MTADNPLLTCEDLPHFSAIRPDHVVPAVAEAIAGHQSAMESCAAADGFDAVFLAKERADARLSRVWQTVSHLTMVANTPELRAAHAEAQPLLSAHLAAVGQDSALYQAIRGIPTDTLSAAERRAIELAVRAFELSGVALPYGPRARFAEISVELDRLATEFSDAVLDATEAWTLPITDEARLAGLPESDRAMLAQQARGRGEEGWLVTLHVPSVRAITAYAEDRTLRRAVYEAYNTRASDQGPNAGRFDNGARIDRILALRQEAAALLGFSDPVAWSLATKMARDADEVSGFLLDLAQRARPGAEADLADLAAFARDRLGIDALEPWDIAFASERLRLERHAIDEAAIKRYLPLPRVLEGLFGLLGDLFDVQVRPGQGVDTWHPDVRYYTLHRDHADAPFAALYCDFFARAGKRGGAWMDVCRPRLLEADAPQIPIAFLVCNFGEGVEGRPPTITHNDMVTLFHEMGHCLHHMLTEVDLPSVGGISGVEWDAVELPSQFLENFAWEPAMLRRVSAHEETGEPLPEATIARMLGARRFLAAMALLRQVEFALFDIRLHLAAATPGRATVMEVVEQVRREVAVVLPPAWHRSPHAFSHIFAGGYASGYYSYLWAERLSADAFEPFAEEGADRPVLGGRFREQVLARGGTRPAIENYVAFRGREPRTDALLRSWGLAA